MPFRKFLWLAILSLSFSFGCSNANSSSEQLVNEPTSAPTDQLPAHAQLTTLVVNFPDQQPPKVWEVEAGSTLSVRELMNALQDAQFSFTDTLYPGMGHLVTSIAGKKNAGGEGAYWQFCVDNVVSDRGVDEKTVAPGQQVDWHYSKYGELPCKKIGE